MVVLVIACYSDTQWSDDAVIRRAVERNTNSGIFVNDAHLIRADVIAAGPSYGVERVM